MSVGTHPDIPEKNWSNPFTPGTPLHERFDKIVRNNRDLIIIIDDGNGSRGTGKTVCSLQLANGMDQTPEGITSEKVTMNPEEIREAYHTQPKRSALVFDEGEVGASNRDSMTTTNKVLREIMSMGRVEEKYVIINTPLKQFIDKDLQKLADIWMSMDRKGRAMVHFFEWQRYAETLLTPKQQTFTFQDIPKGTQLREVYNELTQEKKGKIRGDDDSGFITREEHQSRLESEVQEAERETRNALVRDVMNHPSIEASQSDMADVIGVSQQQVSNLLNDE